MNFAESITIYYKTLKHCDTFIQLSILKDHRRAQRKITYFVKKNVTIQSFVSIDCCQCDSKDVLIITSSKCIQICYGGSVSVLVYISTSAVKIGNSSAKSY